MCLLFLATRRAPSRPRCGLLSSSVAILVQVLDTADFLLRVAVERLVLDTACIRSFRRALSGARLTPGRARSRSPRNPYVEPAVLGPRPPVEPPSLRDRVAQLQGQNLEFKGDIANALELISDLAAEVSTLARKQRRLENKIESLEARLTAAELRVSDLEPVDL